MNVASIAMKFASLLFAGSIFFILFKRVKVLKKFGIISLIYVLLISILLATPTLFLLFDLNISDINLLLLAQFFILLIGIVHVVFNPSLITWYKDQPFKFQVLFILCILFLSYFFSDLSLSFIVSPKLRLVWFLSLLWFVVPTLLNETVNQLLLVPPKVYTQWFYPLNERIDDPSDEELANPIVISFVFRKNNQSDEVTTFRAKAPVGMTLGRLFYFFINDYNDRHPESRITFLNNEGEPHGWIFLKIKNKFLGSKDAIDPASSIYSNNIKENDVLICNRI
jgi:hypothetical protein